MTLYAIDFGAGSALAIHGPNGPISKRDLKLPRQKGGKTAAQEFVMIAEALLGGCEGIPAGDIVIESPTIGSSGCEVADVADLLDRYPKQRIYTISARAVKNYRADNNIGWEKGARYAKDGDPPPVIMTLEEQKDVHVRDAELIYRIATEHPKRLYWWRGPSSALERLHTSVRPMDKRGYRDERAEAYMSQIPPYNTLPAELKDVVGDGKDYSRSFIMPFAMATDEPHLDDGPRENMKRRWEKIIGLYDRGYPSFYRRATIVWMQKNAKRLADVTKIGDVDPATRKDAWKITQRQIRQFFHLTMAHQGR